MDIQIFKNWVLTGSKDGTIKVWNNETYKCLKILGKSNPKILKENLSRREILELTKNIDIKFHLGGVICIDINDKYLVSGSYV